MFNSQIPIATGGKGLAYRFGVVIALGDPPSSANLVYQPIVDSWEIEEGGDLFVVFGEHNADARGLIGKFNGGGALELFHGVIVEPCDPTCSTYKVRRIHRYLIAGCDDCGSAEDLHDIASVRHERA